MTAPAARTVDDHPRLPARSLVMAGMSTVIEWYDFTLYLYMTAVISRVFFDGGASGTAATLFVFAATYLLRPVGAAFFGNLGDRIGRRPVLLISMAMMTVAMAVTAALPTHAQAGALAGWLMLLTRCVMSFSVGGEYSGVITYLVEGAEPRRRGVVASLASAASEVGGLVAIGLAALTTTFISGPDLDSWGWRIPFAVGAVMAGAVLLARSTMEESPVFEAEAAGSADGHAKVAPGDTGHPLLDVLRTEPAAVLRGFAISALGSITYYIGIGYAPTFLTQVGKFSERDANWLAVGAAVAVIAVTPLTGLAADRWGRRPLFLLFGGLAVATSLTMFQLMSAGNAWSALVGALVLAAVAGGWSAVAASAIAEQFHSRSRMSGMALGFTTATAIFGGFAPLVAQKLSEGGGQDWIPGAMIAVVALCVVPVVWFQPETAPRLVARENAAPSPA